MRGVGSFVTDVVFFQVADGAIATVRIEYNRCDPAATPTARKPIGAAPVIDVGALLHPDAPPPRHPADRVHDAARRGRRLPRAAPAARPGWQRAGALERLPPRLPAPCRPGTDELHVRPVNHGKDRTIGRFEHVTGMDWDDDYGTTLAITDRAGLHLVGSGPGVFHAEVAHLVRGAGLSAPAAWRPACRSPFCAPLETAPTSTRSTRRAVSSGS